MHTKPVRSSLKIANTASVCEWMPEEGAGSEPKDFNEISSLPPLRTSANYHRVRASVKRKKGAHNMPERLASG
jgi:hypothetical protein